MLEQVKYYEDYEIGEARDTVGRTITETDFVVHAGHSGDFFFRITLMRNFARRCRSANASRTARWCSPSASD